MKRNYAFSPELNVPIGVRWGNVLYFLLQSEITGRKVSLYKDKTHTYWLEHFPEFKEKIVYRPDFEMPTSTNYFQFLDDDFCQEQLECFVRKYFLNHSKILKSRQENEQNDTLYINIRRGDFYSSRFIQTHGFDIIGFIKHCFEKQKITKQKNIAFISDEIQWCEQNLQFLDKYGDNLIFMDLTPIEAFLTLSTAKKLLITNSTFSYWAAYISGIIHGKNSEIYTPNFTCRLEEHKDNKQFLPHWHRVKDFDCNEKEFLLAINAKPGRFGLMLSEEQKSFLHAFGKKVKQLRTKKGLSQEELNRMCCYKPGLIKYLELGEFNIDIRTVVNIAKCLDTSMADIFESMEIEHINHG